MPLSNVEKMYSVYKNKKSPRGQLNIIFLKPQANVDDWEDNEVKTAKWPLTGCVWRTSLSSTFRFSKHRGGFHLTVPTYSSGTLILGIACQFYWARSGRGPQRRLCVFHSKLQRKRHTVPYPCWNYFIFQSHNHSSFGIIVEIWRINLCCWSEILFQY